MKFLKVQALVQQNNLTFCHVYHKCGKKYASVRIKFYFLITVILTVQYYVYSEIENNNY